LLHRLVEGDRALQLEAAYPPLDFVHLGGHRNAGPRMGILQRIFGSLSHTPRKKLQKLLRPIYQMEDGMFFVPP
jgi:hypothetical protein